MISSLLLLFTNSLLAPSTTALPLLHRINVDGFIFCPDGRAPPTVTVTVRDGDEDAELLRKVFSPADEYCLTVEDFVDVKASHPTITLYAHCLKGGKDCIYQQTTAIPLKFLDNSLPFRPTFNATEANLKSCMAN